MSRLAAAVASDEAALPAPVMTDSSLQPFYFSIPAPRGQILDCEGRPLARTKVVQRLTLRVPPLAEETAEAYAAWVAEFWPQVAQLLPETTPPAEDLLKQQFEHRRRIPLVISGPLSVEEVGEMERPEFVEVQTEYAREYPEGRLAAHVVGYVTTTGAPLRGPLQYGEPLWRDVEGRQGLEATMNAELTGQPGLMVVSYDKEGRAVQRHVLKAPVPGKDVVTTLQLRMQESAEKALGTAKRPGAMVIVDVSTGSIMALASAPTFDPALFAAGVDSKTFEKIKKDPSQPLFHRAVSALYPPGSVFKPFVALAGLRNGRLSANDLIPCGPEMVIDGRLFRNWTDKDSGYFDLNGAIIRSFNTYFYQTAIAIGDQPILTTAREFGFGQPIELPLAGVAKGDLPKKIPSRQGVANISIGQSPLLSSPLEVAMAMATVADGFRRPKARLVSQVQAQDGAVVSATLPGHHNAIRFPTNAMVAIHDAMYGVVNHKDGTGAKARIPSLRVYGKTGTAQWSTKGAMESAVWFAGFIKDSDPPLAFAVAVEGNKGEQIFGGSVAAPVAAQVLKGIAEKPADYALQTRKVKAPVEDHTLAFNRDLPIPTMAVQETVAAASLGSRHISMPTRQAFRDEYYGDYPDSAPAPPPPPPGAYSSYPPTYYQPVRPRAPAQVQRAIPVEAPPLPDRFFAQPPPEPSPYYERARSRPRRSSAFIFPRR